MSITSELRARLQGLFSRQRLETDLDEELRSHLNMELEELMQQGLSEQEARRKASLSFGGMSTVVEECREQRGIHWVEETLRDIRVGLRGLWRSPSFTLAALSSLGLGVGATLVIYALVQAVLLNPLPYHDPDRLVRFNEVTPEGRSFSTSDLNISDFAERAVTLDAIAVESFPAPKLLLALGNTERSVQGLRVSGNFFDVLGVTPAHGRWWQRNETLPGTSSRQVILSQNLWTSLFDAEPLTNQTIALGGETWEILGVTKPEFRFGTPTDLWLPYALELDRNRGDHRLSAIARLADDTDLPIARQEVAAIASALSEEYPDANEGWSAQLEPLRSDLIGSTATRTSVALLAAVGLLLLLACSSVSSLTMARAAGRKQELSLRRALGASRVRLVRQLVTESLLLGGAGTLLGIALAAVLVPSVRSMAANAMPRIDQMTLSVHSLVAASLIAITTSMLFGIAPAATASTSRAAGSRTGKPQRLRSVLVALQLGLALVLAMSSLTLFQSFARMTSIDPGFDADKLLAVDITLPPDRYPEGSDQVLQFYRSVLETASNIPGVTHAAGSTLHPFIGPDLANNVSLPEGVHSSETLPVAWRAVTPGAFSTMGIPLLHGRDFQSKEPSLVAIVSVSLAKQLYGDQDPIGQRVRWIPPNGPVATIIGVVANTRDLTLDTEPLPTYYWFQDHMRWTDMSLLLRTDGNPDNLIATVRAAIRAVDPNLPPSEIRAVIEDFRNAAATPRLALQVFGSFAFLALVIALVGLYGLISYTASSRRSEIALRLAIGAKPLNVGQAFVRQGLKLLLFGLGFGLLGTFMVAKLLSQVLYETTPLEPAVLLIAVSLFLAVTVAASLIPALRIARQNPRAALMGYDG